MFFVWKNVVFLQPQFERISAAKRGALAQLARALAWHARGHRFDSVMLHKTKNLTIGEVFRFISSLSGQGVFLPNGWVSAPGFRSRGCFLGEIVLLSLSS